MPKLGLLASPLKEFRVPNVSWRPSQEQFQRFQDQSRITFTAPEPIEIKGRAWYRVVACDVKDVQLGEFLLPFKYHALWRRLVYGALFQEKMFKAWVERTNRLNGRKMIINALQQEEVRLTNMAGVRFVQHLVYQHAVLEELMKLRFDNHEPVVYSLIEFGIRDSRDWMFESFEHAKKEGARYLRLDPTVGENKQEFEKGYHPGLEILFPPEDDEWWDGEFSHFNFKATFNEIVKSVPKTMAHESFKKIKWTIECTNAAEPVDWNKVNVTFFSDFFINFLKEEGVDPRDDGKAYIVRYCMHFDQDDGGFSDGISRELKVVLGDRYNQQAVEEITMTPENCDVHKVLRLFENRESRTGQAPEQGEASSSQADDMAEERGALTAKVPTPAAAAADSGAEKAAEHSSRGLADVQMGEAGSSTGRVSNDVASGDREEGTVDALSEYITQSRQLLS